MLSEMSPAAKLADGTPAPPGACLNCGAPLHGEYCHDCGQRDIDPRASLWHVLGEFIQESLELDGRLPRTLVPFLFRPGFLAREFLEGRRQRYTSPVRLYVFCALVAFFMLAQAADRQLAADSIVFNGDVSLGEDGDRGLSFGADPETHSPVRLDIGGVEDDGRLHIDDSNGRVPTALRELDGMDKQAAVRTLVGHVFDWAPLGAVGLLFIYAALLKLFFPRVPVLTHVVASTHLHAFALLALAVAATVGRTGAGLVAFGVVSLYAAVSLWQSYRQVWWATLLKFFALGSLYLVFAVLAVTGVILAVLFLS